MALILAKALIITLWLSVVFAIFGIFVIIKRMAFFSDGIAHAAVLGLAIGFTMGLSNNIIIIILESIIFAILIFLLEKNTKINPDALVSIIFVISLSFGLIILSSQKGYQPELINFIIGNPLVMSNFDFYFILIFCLLTLIFIIFNFKKILLVILDPTEARLININSYIYELVFYIFLALSVVLGIKIGGVMLITSFLILPPTIASFIAKSLQDLISKSIIIAVVSVIVGYMLAYLYNFPVSASIILFSSIIFILMFFNKYLSNYK